MRKFSTIFILTILGFLSGCATKYVIPGNRFLTPETLGDAFRGQVEIQQTNGNQLVIDTSNDDVNSGVLYSDISRTGFYYANSFFDQFDLYWSHLGAGNSMIGGKFQFIGDSRARLSTGHKVALAAAIGGNEHETDDKSVEFSLTGKEVLGLYGYRVNPFFMPYGSMSYAQYNFEGKFNNVGNPTLNGLRPEIMTTIFSLSGGLELSYYALIFKIESTFQRLETTKTKDKNRLIFGYTLGVNW